VPSNVHSVREQKSSWAFSPRLVLSLTEWRASAFLHNSNIVAQFEKYNYANLILFKHQKIIIIQQLILLYLWDWSLFVILSFLTLPHYNYTKWIAKFNVRRSQKRHNVLDQLQNWYFLKTLRNVQYSHDNWNSRVGYNWWKNNKQSWNL
jgi:hypothetical protein